MHNRGYAHIVATVTIVVIAALMVGVAWYYDANREETPCTLLAKVCPDGSTVGQHGPNCDWDPCPTGVNSATLNVNAVMNGNVSAETRVTFPFGNVSTSCTDDTDCILKSIDYGYVDCCAPPECPDYTSASYLAVNKEAFDAAVADKRARSCKLELCPDYELVRCLRNTDTHFAACDAGVCVKRAASTSVLDLTVETYPSVDGSTSTHPLAVQIASSVLGIEAEWMDEIFGDGSKRLYLLESEPSIFHNGTHGSYENLIDGDADLILVARLPSDDELTAAGDAGVTLEPQAVANDAFVFIANTSNPVTGLTTDQIRSVYTGATTHWGDLGGSDVTITPYTRNDNSGSQELMRDLVMGDRVMVDAEDMMLLSMMGPISAITQNANGIGYSVYYYEQFMAPNDSLQLLAIDGVLPTSETISDGSYPYATEVYAVIRDNEPPTSTAHRVYDWLLTDAGQSAIAESGYVPL